MTSALQGGNIVARFKDGEDLHASILALLKEHGYDAGLVVFGIGMLRDFELGFFDGKKYHPIQFHDPMELVALHGTIAGENIHLHAGVADQEHELHGGHLATATVNVTCEIMIKGLDQIFLTREPNRETGLTDLAVSARK